VAQFTGINHIREISTSSNSELVSSIESPHPNLSISDFASSERDNLNELLWEHGYVLLRGFKVGSEVDFEHFVREFSGRDLFNYSGGASPRTALSAGGLYTSTEYPPEIRIPLHNELSYSRTFPYHLFFWCVTPAGHGGETTLADSRKILHAIEPAIVNRFKDKSICYVRNLHSDKGSGYSWQDAFETDSPAEAEQKCHKVGAQFEWLNEGYLRVTQICPATIVHPITGEEVWFNQADGFHSLFAEDRPRLESRFGDGSKINISDLQAIRKAIDVETLAHKWQKDDVIIIDNILAAHGRMPFTGSRKILLAMT